MHILMDTFLFSLNSEELEKGHVLMFSSVGRIVLKFYTLVMPYKIP